MNSEIAQLQKDLLNLKESNDKKISNLKNKHTDVLNKQNLENFNKIKELRKTIETMETEKFSLPSIEKNDKNSGKSFSVKELNEKVKQKTAILEFNLKKD